MAECVSVCGPGSDEQPPPNAVVETVRTLQAGGGGVALQEGEQLQGNEGL